MTLNDAPASAPLLRYRGIAGHAPIVLWAVPVSDMGGVARHVLDVARVGLPRTRLVVLCPEGPLAERLHEMGVPVLIEDFGPDAGVRASVRSLRHAVAKLRPAVLHTHLAYADIIAALAIPPRWRVALATTNYRPRRASASHIVQLRFRTRFDLTLDLLAAAPEYPYHRRTGLRLIATTRDVGEDHLRLLQAFAILHVERPESILTIHTDNEELQHITNRARISLGIGDAISVKPSEQIEFGDADVFVTLDRTPEDRIFQAHALRHHMGLLTGTDSGWLTHVPSIAEKEPQEITRMILTQAQALGERPAIPSSLSPHDAAQHIVDGYRRSLS